MFLRKLRPPRTPYTVVVPKTGFASQSTTDAVNGRKDGTESKQNTISPQPTEGQTWLETWCTSVLQIGINCQHPSVQGQTGENGGWTMTDCCAKIAEYEMETRKIVQSTSRSMEDSRKRSRSPSQQR